MIERKDSNFYTQALRELRAKESELEQKLRRLENSRMPRKLEDRLQYVNDTINTRRELSEIRDQKVLYLYELENLKDEKADFESEEYCECVGNCYGKSIYVDGEGEILYADAEDNGADSIGDPAFSVAGLKSLDVLPEAERYMILKYLDESEDTPIWFKNRND